MGDVIQFEKEEEDFKHTSYLDFDGDLGVITNDRTLAIRRLNDQEFDVSVQGSNNLFNREELAEFLWVAAIFVDDEERFKPEGTMVCCDYSDDSPPCAPFPRIPS